MAAVVVGALSSFAGQAAYAYVGLQFGVFAGSIAGAATSLFVASALNDAFGLTQKANEQTVERPSQMVRSPKANRFIVYGETVLSGPLVFAATSGTNPVNQTLHLVVPLADHEVEDIPSVWIGDTEVIIDDLHPGGWVITGKLARVTNAYKLATYRVGISTETTLDYDESVLKSISVVDPASGNPLTDVSPADPADNTEYKLSGTTLTIGPIPGEYDPESQNLLSVDVNYTYNAALYEIATYNKAQVGVWIHKGSPTQSADPLLVSEVTEWTAEHRLSNVAYVYVRLGVNKDLFSSGIPNIKAKVKGRKIYDPSKDSTLSAYGGSGAHRWYDESTWEWSDNWALCVRDYLTSTQGINANNYEIDDEQCITSVEVCNETVVLPDASSQVLYTCNGAIDLGDKPSSIMEGMCTAAAGTVVYTQGKYRIFPGTYTLPVASLDDSNLRAPMDVQARTSIKSLFNSVRGTFVDPDDFYQPTDFPLQTNATYVAQDNGDTLYRDIQLPFTANTYMAQRIAKIHLEKSRQGIIVNYPANFSALNLCPYDNIQLTSARMGWSNKIFKIISWRLSEEGVDLVMQEEASASYDWNSGDATVVDPAPDTNLPSSFSVDPITDLTLTETPTRVADRYKSKVEISWTASDYPFVVGYEVEAQTYGSSEWIPLYAGDQTQIDFEDVPTGVTYTIRVRAYNTVGVKSEWTYKSFTTVGVAASLEALGLPDPADPQVFATVNDAGEVNKFVLRASYTITTEAIPDGIALFVHVSKFENKIAVQTDESTRLKLDPASAILANGSGGDFTVLAGSTASQLVLRDSSNPLPINVDFSGHFWCTTYDATDAISNWTKVLSNDETTVYLANDLTVTPAVGKDVPWAELAWVDNRSSPYKLGAITDGVNYEIIKWDHVEEDSGNYYISGLTREQEGTTQLDASGRDFHYYPALGYGTETILFEKESIVSTLDPATSNYEFSKDVSISIPEGYYVTMTCCAYIRTSDSFIRGNIIPVEFGGYQ